MGDPLDDSLDVTPPPDSEKGRRTSAAKGHGRKGPGRANSSGPVRKVLDVDVLIEELLSVSTNTGEFAQGGGRWLFAGPSHQLLVST